MKHLIVLFICSLLSISVQCKAAYKLKITRVEITRTNKEYAEARLRMTKPNRYTNAVTGDFYLYNIPHDTKVRIKLYEFLSNEYRPFAINLERDLCSYLTISPENKMTLYPDFLKTEAHMPEPKCPIKPGNYSFVDLVPDIGNFPANVPFHNWMLKSEFWHGPVEMLTVPYYGILDRDAVIREQYG